ncbi:MAG: hypothetical protein U5L00_09435 [Desulfovermiculus sp.]|nr:hypothetical protein [Desulfovermiculus sp.]
MTATGDIGVEAFLSTRWREAMQAALERNAGELLSGLAHNLHNYAHSFSMQMELLNNAWQRNPKSPLWSQKRSFERMTAFSSDFFSECSSLSDRPFYARFKPDSIDISSFLDWLQGFWRHNLFFKHHMQVDISLAQDVPKQVSLTPGGLLYCLEEGLKNGMESLAGTGGSQENFQIYLQIATGKEGLEFALHTPTSLDPGIDPWQVGTSTKPDHLGLGLPLLRIGCREMGWDCRLSDDDRSTTLSFTVPQ